MPDCRLTTIDRYGHMMHLGHYADVGVRLDEKGFTPNEEEAQAETKHKQ
ncbi:MAG: hypothetical protein KAR05_12070 [Candidatus Omnitrophica bacterium]|nr:hypothetical protein [Candidatus Omnitrophota bacterium]